MRSFILGPYSASAGHQSDHSPAESTLDASTRTDDNRSRWLVNSGQVIMNPGVEYPVFTDCHVVPRHAAGDR